MKRDPNCTLCKLHQTAQFVCLLGQGPRRCDIMVIGEAPGKREDDSGKPFVGVAGVLLEERLEEEARLTREEVFITNAVSCRPPNNRTPRKSEINACKKWLDYQIAQVKPKYVLLLGNVPLQSITGEGRIKSRRGRPFEKDGIIYLPTFHPAFVLRDPTQDGKFRRDLRLFREIIDRGGIPREDNVNCVIVQDARTFQQLLRDLHGTVSVDIESTCLYPWQTHVTKRIDKKDVRVPDPAKIVSIGFGTRDTQYVLPVHAQAWKTPWSRDMIETMLIEIGERLQDCFIVAHNGKFDFLWLWVEFGLKWYEWFDFDTMLAHYILDENDHHGLDHCATKYFGAPDYDVPLTLKQGRSGTLGQHADYLAHDLYYTRKLRFKLGKMLRQDGEVKRVFDEIMMPCSRLFVEVEYDGVCIDTTKFDEAEDYLRSELAKSSKEMSKWGDINWGSPKQLAALLFTPKRKGGLGIDIVEKTKTGAASTSESVIKRIDHPIAGALLKFRGAKQQLSFFIEGWKPFLHKRRNGMFLHPSFKLHGTVTGRLSCEHPNLQQVPRDKRIRQLITAPPGWTLVEADLSQIELRIAAELAQERHMLEAFRENIDIHWLTAIRELERGGGGKHVETIKKTAYTYLVEQGKKPNRAQAFSEALEIVLKMGPSEAERVQATWKEDDPEKLWKEIRKKAKAVNFGYLYGMWWKKFKIYARDNYGVILTDEQAEASRDFYFKTFSDLPKWHDRQRRYVRQNGYVRSLSGRKRRLPAAQMREDTPERREAERQAINSPVQSFANELNLMSAIQLRREFGRDVARIVGTVHDSILLWVKNEHVERVTSRLLEIMSHPDLLDVFGIELGVPVLAEAKVGAWGIGEDFHKWQKKTHSELANRRSRPGAAASARSGTSTSRSSGARRSADRSRSAA